MKKVLYFATLLLCAVFTTSCEKEEVGSTATESMAGQWYVTVDAVDESGNLVYSDEELFGLGAQLAADGLQLGGEGFLLHSLQLFGILQVPLGGNELIFKGVAGFHFMGAHEQPGNDNGHDDGRNGGY